MLRLQKGGIIFNNIRQKLSRRYLSNEFRQVLNTYLENPDEDSINQIKMAALKRNLNTSNFDLYVNNLKVEDEDSRLDVLDFCHKLRLSKLTGNTLESTHFAVVRYLLHNINIAELLTILENRLHYGIFLNEFTAFAVLDKVLEENICHLALPLLTKLVLYDSLEGDFLQLICIKSCLLALTNEFTASANETATPKEDTPTEKVKVRVKFIRNPLEIDPHLMMSKVLQKICNKDAVKDNVKENLNILALVLAKCYNELEAVLHEKSFSIYHDVYNLCIQLLNKQNKTDTSGERLQNIKNHLEKNAVEECLDKQLDIFIKSVMDENEPLIIEMQKQIFPKWKEERLQHKQAVDKEHEEIIRKSRVEKTLEEISSMEQHLWFFEKEEQIDLAIDNKLAKQPKATTSKSKNLEDENYIPPEIR